MRWLTRIRNTFSSRSLETDLSDEFRDHLTRRAEELEREGLSPTEARRRAALWFGNTAVIREESREIRMWSEVQKTFQDLRYGLRGLVRNPALALTGIVSLSLAIGANTGIFSIVNAAFLRPLPVPAPRNLFTLTTSNSPEPGDLFSYPLYEELRTAAAGSARIALLGTPNRVEAQIDGPDSPYEQATQQFLSPDAFDILGISPASGQLLSAALDHYPSPRTVVVLSHRYWMRRFGGDTAALGRTIDLDGRTFRILGVAREGFTGVEPGKFVDIWVPVTLFDPAVFTNPDARLFRLLGRFASGANRAQLTAHLQSAFRNHQNRRLEQDPGMPAIIKAQMTAQTLATRDAAGGISTFEHAYSRPLLILAIVSFCILLIACSNLAGLLLARSAARSAEIALRVSLGARRGRLIRQLLTENLLTLIPATFFGFALSGIGAPMLLSMVSTRDNPVQLDLSADIRPLLFSAAICALAVLIAGMMPALQATTSGPAAALRQVGASAGRLRLGRIFVTAQVAFAFCLVTLGSGFLYSLRNLTSLDPGFSPAEVTVLTMTGNSRDRTRQIELLRQLPSRLMQVHQIHSAATAWMPVLSGARRAQRVLLPGKQVSNQEVTFYRVSPGYFATLRTPLAAGRDLSWRDNDNEPIPTVVNRAFARLYFRTDSAIGREFQRDDGVRHLVVGLAADSHFVDLRIGPEPIAYMPMKPTRAFTLYVRSTLDSISLSRIADREAKALASGLRVRDVTTLDAIVGNTILKERLLAYLGGTFAAIGLALAAIGIFGLLNYSVSLRKGEIGIREALGAGSASIGLLVLKDTVRMTGGGLLAGILASLGLMRLAQSLLFEIHAADPLVLGSALFCFLLVALFAAGLPAHRAMAIDPIRALRHE